MKGNLSAHPLTDAEREYLRNEITRIEMQIKLVEARIRIQEARDRLREIYQSGRVKK